MSFEIVIEKPIDDVFVSGFRESCIALFESCICSLLGSKIILDYGVYVENIGVYSYGLTWMFNNITYSAKVSGGVFKDLYIIHPVEYPLCASIEIDAVTMKPNAFYPGHGFDKIDGSGVVLCKSYPSFGEDCLPDSLLADMKKTGFPFSQRCYGYSAKPYGMAAEFTFCEPGGIYAFYN